MSLKTGTKVGIKTGLKLNENAIRVLEKRYLKKDDKGNIIETPEDMFRRVARAVAAAELIYNDKADAKPWEDEFYRLMTSLEFLPNSPTLLNAGRELGQLSACFVLPVNDSVESIFNTVKQPDCLTMATYLDGNIQICTGINWVGASHAAITPEACVFQRKP